MLAKEVMDRSASLLNDTARSIFTYVAQIPYLNMAMDELQELMEQNNVPVTEETSTSINISLGTTSLSFTTNPALPSNLIEIQRLWERLQGSTEDWQPMNRKDYLPSLVTQTASLVNWIWQNQQIEFIGATTNRNLRIDYIASRLPVVETENTVIELINARSFLAYRNAGLCAQFIGENSERAEALNTMAILSFDRFVVINTKGRQSNPVRRRPFMANYRSRSVL